MKKLKGQKFNTNIRRYKKINSRVIFYSILLVFSFITN